MNERIIEMAKQCGDWSGQTIEMNDVGITKFAQLIVKECLDIVNRHEYSYHEADPLWETAQLIKERFGVEG
jgi:hypothetical protein